MKNEDVYQCWKDGHRKVATSPDFRMRVMDEIARKAERGARPRPALIERITVRSWAPAAAIGVAALIGFGRILLTLHVLLFA